MKKLIVCLLAFMLLLSSCACAEGNGRKTDFADNTFVEMDPKYITGITQRGKTVMFRYDAQTEEGQAYTKNALVYVPYGYDAEDTDTRYNVLYLMHGCGGEGDVGYSGMTAQINAMSLLTDTFVYCENFRDGNLYYTQCSGGHSTKSVELIMYDGLPAFFD